jgi:citrate lyase subunit beta/citryl-CoA lyase
VPGIVRRSWLMVPASKPELVECCSTFGADVIVFDLEDLVHDARKYEARARIKDGIGEARRGGAEVFVRCDRELLYADLEASVWHGLDGVILPKVTSPAHIEEADAILTELELARGVTHAALPGEIDEADDARSVDHSLELHLMIENARGNHEALDLIAASPRVRSISLGRADLVMDLRPEPSGELHMMPYLMQRLIMLAGKAGVTPIGAWWQGTSRGLQATPADTEIAARRGRAAGFKGALCVDPDQVEPLNRGFTPAADEVERAQNLIDAFAHAEAAGRPYAEADGALIDRATAGAAEALLDWAEACVERERLKAAALQTA